MGVHAVFGAGGESFDAPFADEGFPGAGFGEALLFADAFHDVHELGHGGDVGHEYSAGDEELFGDGEAFPGFYGLIAASPSGDEDDMERDEIEFLLKDREQDSLGPAMTMDELRRLATSTPAPSGPARPAVNWQVVPMRIGLSIPQTLSVVEQVLDGAAIKSVLKRLGGRPSIRACCPILRGDGWLAERSPFTRIWSIEVVTEPKGKSRRFDDRHVADYAWRIAQALERRYGFPYGIRTTNNGLLMRLFQVGDHGVKVTSGFSKVEVEIDSFQTLLEDSYGC